jgi:hypothetical protein
VVAAHDAGATGTGQTVAVVDTGVVTGVADLAGRVSQRLRCTDPGCMPAVAAPTSSHGTEVASVVAVLDNTTGTTGVPPGATVVSYRVDSTGGGIPISYLRQALLHIAADDDIDVVNLSLGGSQWSAAEQEGIDAVLAAGRTVVASAGNTGDRIPQYPASFPGVISVGATDDGGQIAGFSSYGKVDVVAPGDCVAVAEVPGFLQDRGCPGDDLAGVAFNSGTSFSAPIVSGLLAPAPSRSPLVARLAVGATADPTSPAGDDDAKPWAHGLVDADAFVDAHDPGAPPGLVLETSGGQGGSHRLGSGDGQLAHPDTTHVADAFKAGDDGVAANPGTASFSGAVPGGGAFSAVAGDSGTFKSTLASGPLDPGLREQQATATVDGESAAGSVPVLALEDDDQAPGADLVGSGNDAWRRLDSVDGPGPRRRLRPDLGKGDRLDVAIASLSPDPVAALLFDAGTEDVFGQLDHALACGGGEEVSCPTAGLPFEAAERATYLLDVYSTAASGDYRLTWTVRNAAGLPIEATTAACSPNGDGVQDRCAWSAGTISGWTIRSFVTSGASLVAQRDGAGAKTWDGGDSDPGGYTLRVLYTEAGGRALLRAFALTLDEQRPRIADANAAPQPVRAAAPRRRPGHHHLRHDLLRAGPAPGGDLPLRHHRRGPGPGQRRAGGRAAAGPLDREDVVGRLAPGTVLLRARGHRAGPKTIPDNRLTGFPGPARVALHLAEGPSSAGRVSCRPASAEEVSIVIDRQLVTLDLAHTGPKGDVCPEPATIGTRLRTLGRSATAAPVAVFGGQGGRQAFAVDGREVPT